MTLERVGGERVCERWRESESAEVRHDAVCGVTRRRFSHDSNTIKSSDSHKNHIKGQWRVKVSNTQYNLHWGKIFYLLFCLRSFILFANFTLVFTFLLSCANSSFLLFSFRSHVLFSLTRFFVVHSKILPPFLRPTTGKGMKSTDFICIEYKSTYIVFSWLEVEWKIARFENSISPQCKHAMQQVVVMDFVL